MVKPFKLCVCCARAKTAHTLSARRSGAAGQSTPRSSCPLKDKIVSLSSRSASRVAREMGDNKQRNIGRALLWQL
jgi:hypothetical protein